MVRIECTCIAEHYRAVGAHVKIGLVKARFDKLILTTKCYYVFGVSRL